MVMPRKRATPTETAAEEQKPQGSRQRKRPTGATETTPKVISCRPKVTAGRPKVTAERPKVTEERPDVCKPEQPKVTNGRRRKRPAGTTEASPKVTAGPEVTSDRPKVTPKRPKVTPKSPKVTPKSPKVTPKRPKVNKSRQRQRAAASPVATTDQPEVAGRPRVTLKGPRTGGGDEAEALGAVSAPVRLRPLLGCHVSAAGGVHNAVGNALACGARAFGLFLLNQRRWDAPPLDPGVAAQFRAALGRSGIAPAAVVAHGSYLMNCASPEPPALARSRARLTAETLRCQQLGIPRLVFHPGSTLGRGARPEGLQRVAESVNAALEATSGVTLLLENMSGQANTVGGRFEELAAVIERVTDKDRVGVCLDTCHLFAAGFDLRSRADYEATMGKFEAAVGLRFLKAVHVNDSKAGLGSHLDRHEDVGKGQLGLEAFRHVVNDPRLAGLPLILETPGFADYGRQIRLLESLFE